jgi:hypothetical protein
VSRGASRARGDRVRSGGGRVAGSDPAACASAARPTPSPCSLSSPWLRVDSPGSRSGQRGSAPRNERPGSLVSISSAILYLGPSSAVASRTKQVLHIRVMHRTLVRPPCERRRSVVRLQWRRPEMVASGFIHLPFECALARWRRTIRRRCYALLEEDAMRRSSVIVVSRAPRSWTLAGWGLSCRACPDRGRACCRRDHPAQCEDGARHCFG